MIKFAISGFNELTRNTLNQVNRCESNRRLDGQIVVITGGNAGIGKETAYQLASRGAQVIIGCRSLEKGNEAINDMKATNDSVVLKVVKLDLASMKSVRLFAQQVEQLVDKIDVLINNAGVMMCPEWKTADGFEMQFGTNHLGHFLLTMHLLPLLKKSTGGTKVINVSSIGHMLGNIYFDNINLVNGAYKPFKAYNQSKLANVMFTSELARRLGKTTSGQSVKAYAVHPGFVDTQVLRHISMGGQIGSKVVKKFLLKPEMGCQTILYCILDDSVANESGYFYA
ncbi:retinol dehydrogenase 11-like [Oppia nitens]|uniref:retinol dehydrogenase 11-like n=1 Tax=Oppia nitens TaxID=1686743 RepID=UPI0023DC8FC0|nr:retinol dehydrogenase 11-like [Oppia nitens]